MLPEVDGLFFLVGRNGIDAFHLPALNALMGLSDLSASHVNLLAGLTLGPDVDGLVDELHSAGFASTVLLCAVGTETTPSEVTTGEDLLVVKAHGVLKCGSDTLKEGLG